MKRRAYLMAALVLLALGACGQKGPLYLPDKTATVVTHPAASPAAAPAAQPPHKKDGQDAGDSPPPQ
ncbi:MAG TPA: lipoprotein [Steroidobacteraceae bacterium]|nr:lipoprotein [Steroidobacteraceae bacterium]